MAKASAALLIEDIALGPSVDGGFFLVGLRAPHPTASLFGGVRAWSTDVVLRETLASARNAGLGCVAIDLALRDVGETWMKAWRGGVASRGSFDGERTARFEDEDSGRLSPLLSADTIEDLEAVVCEDREVVAPALLMICRDVLAARGRQSA